MAHRLTFLIPGTGIDPSTLISELDLSADQLPSIARGLVGLRASDIATQGPSEASVSATPMPAAPFVWREDGRPDWGAMWTSFCDLAMYGGPPHRPKDNAVRLMPEASAAATEYDATRELRRGIWETTNLVSESAGCGWLAVTCHSARMAEWLCAAILLENVEARSVGKCLLVPSSRGFTLESEVKSVITVVAKTVHYWEQHIAGTEAR